MDWCAEGPATYSDRFQLIRNQKERVEAEIKQLHKTLDMLKFKCWYYSKAMEDGNEDIDDKMKKIKPKKKEISLEIEETYDRVRMQADLDDIENVNSKTYSPKTVGGNIDLAL